MPAPIGPVQITVGVLIAVLLVGGWLWLRRRVSIRVTGLPTLGDMLVPEDDPEAEWFKAVQRRSEELRKANEHRARRDW